MKEDVIANFSRLKSNLSAKEFLERMETRYKLDAYHSLSIEGYLVTDELINKVKGGAWKPDGEDMDSKNALAARGLIIPVKSLLIYETYFSVSAFYHGFELINIILNQYSLKYSGCIRFISVIVPV